jgi:acyl-CoA hydrolase
MLAKPDTIAREIAAADNIYVPGSAAESAMLRDWLTARPEVLAGKTIHSVWIAGINGFDHTSLHPAARGVAYFTAPALGDGLKDGRTKLLSLSFSQIYRALERAPLDLAFLHLSPPDADGWCSYGACSDFGPAAAAGARRRVGLINRNMPTTFGSARIRADDLDLLVDAEGPVHTLPASAPNAVMQSIGSHVASLVRNGDVLQLGIGSMQVAVLQALAGHRDLRLHSGMISDAVMGLEESGALAVGEDAIRTGIVAGDTGLMRWIDRNPKLWMAPASETHEPAVLARLENFVAINSALEIDLMGQVNAEARAGRIISSSGGLTDFVRMAGFVPGGRPIVALGSTAARGRISRIVPALAAGTPAAIVKSDPLIVVTEHGIADLRGLDFDEKAERLIAIAAPDHREELARSWREVRHRLFG